MDEGDALLVAFAYLQMMIGRAAKQDAPAVGRMDACEHLDERRFAGAVFTEQGEDLAGLEGE
jgi:hypothetical protein